MTTEVTAMRIATVSGFRDHATKLLRASGPLLITRHGKAVGVYLPLKETQDLPFDLRKELQLSLARSVRQAMEERRVTEEEILEEFERTRQ